MPVASEIIIIPETIIQFHNEWVAFEVLEVDNQNRAYKGRLIAHGPNRNEVWSLLQKSRPHHGYVVFSGEVPPKGLHFIL
jgi:hypothetical protein